MPKKSAKGAGRGTGGGAGAGAAAFSAKVSFEPGDLIKNLDGLDNKVRRAMAASVGRTATQAEAWMRSNAKWQDQTGNARSGLTARPQTLGDVARIVVSHTVPYGIWLEVRWGGRYAIIKPAVDQFLPVAMNLTARLLRLK